MQDVENVFDLVYDFVHGSDSSMRILLMEAHPTFDPNALIMCDQFGRRLLLYAIQSHKDDVVKSLLKHKKIDLSLPLDFIRDPKEFQKYYNFKHVGEFKTKLEDVELSNPPLYHALFAGTAEMIKMLVKKGCNLYDTFETRVSGKMNALHAVNQSRIVLGNIDSKVDMLFKLGFKFNKVPNGTLARSLIHGFYPYENEDCSPFNMKIANEFIKSEISVNVHFEDDDGKTPFMLAIAAGNFKVAKLLQTKGANIEAVDNYGRTAIYFLVDFDQTSLLFSDKKREEEDSDDDDEEDEEDYNDFGFENEFEDFDDEESQDGDNDEDPEYNLLNLMKYIDTFGLSDAAFDLSMKARWKKCSKMINYLIMNEPRFLIMFHDNGHEYIKSGLIYGPEGMENFDYKLFFDFHDLLKFPQIPVDFWAKVLELMLLRKLNTSIFLQVERIIRQKLDLKSFAKLKTFGSALLHSAVTRAETFFAEFLIEEWGADVN